MKSRVFLLLVFVASLAIPAGAAERHMMQSAGAGRQVG